MHLNGQLIPVNDFQSYVALYLLNTDCADIDEEIDDEKEEGKKKTQKQLKLEEELKLEREKAKELLREKQKTFCFETISIPGYTFEIAFIPNFNKSRQFEQVSFVNGVYTMKGGTHVNFIMEKLTKFLVPLVEKRDSKVCLLLLCSVLIFRARMKRRTR